MHFCVTDSPSPLDSDGLPYEGDDVLVAAFSYAVLRTRMMLRRGNQSPGTELPPAHISTEIKQCVGGTAVATDLIPAAPIAHADCLMER
jgi:hypothetical protein